MSKVYSFRLNDENPREAQAREVIDAWVGEGFSLRHIVVDALIDYKQGSSNFGELDALMDQLQNLIGSFGKETLQRESNVALSSSFLDGIKHSVKSGIREG